MTKTYVQPRPLRFTRPWCSNAFTVVFLLLSALKINVLTVSAFAPHKQQHQPQHFVRFAPIADPDRTVVGMVSTLVSDGYDIMEDANDHTTRSVFTQHQPFPFRAVPKKNSITDHAQLPHRPSVSTTCDLELPARRAVENQVPTAMETAERICSRVSMVTALVLIVNELATGQSLPDQIGSVVMTVLMV